VYADARYSDATVRAYLLVVQPFMNALQQRKTTLPCAVHDHRLEVPSCKRLLCRSRVGTMFDPDFQLVQNLT